MASTTYRVIQDQPNLSRFTTKQINDAIRSVMATMRQKPIQVNNRPTPAKPRRSRAKE